MFYELPRLGHLLVMWYAHIGTYGRHCTSKPQQPATTNGWGDTELSPVAESEPVLKTKGRRKSIPGAGSIKHQGPAVEPGEPEGPQGASMARAEETLGPKYFALIRVVEQLTEPAPPAGGLGWIATGKRGFKPVSGYPMLWKVLKLPMVWWSKSMKGCPVRSPGQARWLLPRLVHLPAWSLGVRVSLQLIT